MDRTEGSVMTRESFEVFIPALTAGKDRPRATRTGRMYNTTRTTNAEARIEMTWKAAGSPRVPDGPFAVDITLVLDRPASHFRVGGGLSAAGRRAPFPTRKPDVDNVAKLALDALNKLAWRDDAHAVFVSVEKAWASPSMPLAGLTIAARTLVPAVTGGVAA